MTTPTQRLEALVSARDSLSTEAGWPSVDLWALGSRTDLLLHAQELASHPYAPLIARAIVTAGQSATEVLLGFANGLSRQTSFLALRQSCDALISDPHTVAVAGPVLHDSLLPTAAERTAQPVLAAERLEAALRLVLLQARPRWAVMAALTEPVHLLPVEYQDRLARLIGLAMDAFDGAEERKDLRDRLRELAEMDAEDAMAELGRQTLRDALSLTDPAATRAEVERAIEVLSEAAKEEGRDDAVALAAASRAVLAFADGDATTLREAAGQARGTADRIALNLRGMHERAWSTPGRTAQAGWLNLAWQLDSLATELEQDAFLDTTEVLAAIAELYRDDRTVSPGSFAAGSLIRPRIAMDVARRGVMVSQVERAVAADRARNEPLLPPEVDLLLAAVRGASGQRTAATASDDDQESDSAPALTRLLGREQAAAFMAQHPDAHRAVEELAKIFDGRDLLGLGADEDAALVGLEEELLAELANNPYFTGTVAQDFWRLTRLTVRFIKHTLDGREAYLRPFGKRGDAPHEKVLQNHFASWLQCLLGDRVQIEVSNVATGRCDVLVTMGGGVTFTWEIKRELDNASRDSLENSYLGQALEYQGAHVPLGGLLVLDLTAHGQVTAHISDQLWITHRTPPGSKVLRTALGAVVIGNRPPPSKVVVAR